MNPPIDVADEQSFSMLTIGPLPTIADLQALAKDGVDTLINLSGVPLREIYPPEVLTPFDLGEFVVPDLFSRSDVDEAAWRQFQTSYEPLLNAAVGAVGDAVQKGRRVHCFCHQGISRSPLVVAGALVSRFGLSVAGATEMVRAKNPRARFFGASYRMLKSMEFNGLKEFLRV